MFMASSEQQVTEIFEEPTDEHVNEVWALHDGEEERDIGVFRVRTFEEDQEMFVDIQRSYMQTFKISWNLKEMEVTGS